MLRPKHTVIQYTHAPYKEEGETTFIDFITKSIMLLLIEMPLYAEY